MKIQLFTFTLHLLGPGVRFMFDDRRGPACVCVHVCVCVCDSETPVKKKHLSKNELQLGTANTGGGEALRSTLVSHVSVRIPGCLSTSAPRVTAFLPSGAPVKRAEERCVMRCFVRNPRNDIMIVCIGSRTARNRHAATQTLTPDPQSVGTLTREASREGGKDNQIYR